MILLANSLIGWSVTEAQDAAIMGQANSREKIVVEEPTVCLQPQPIGPVPEETARVAQAAFPKGNIYLRLRDELGALYEDTSFAALFDTRGQPAETPWRLALVLVFQFVEDLSDREAADAVRSRIDWKYALGLELTDPGFDASVLSEFRTRLIEGAAERQLLDTMLVRLKAAGLVRARGHQRTDSTHVLAAIRTLSRLECVGETLRYALNTLARVAPEWLRPHLDPAWAERYGPRFDDYRLPKEKAARQALAETIGADGFGLLKAIYAPEAPTWLREVPAVNTLRRVWIQQYYGPTEPIRWRSAEDSPPASLMITSPHDVEAHYGVKRQTFWNGYKAHLTESCDDDLPHLITNVETTPAPTCDQQVLAPVHEHLAANELLPAEHEVDAGYVDAGGIVESQAKHSVEVVGPVSSDRSWQARDSQAFDVALFALDWEGQRAACPEGHPSVKWTPTRDERGNEIIDIRFARTDCLACSQRVHCTRSASEPRHLTVRPQVEHETLQKQRQYQTTDGFKERYRRRAGVEGTISQGVRVADLRRARYFGLAKTHLQHVLTAAALNVRRLGAWWAEVPLAQSRPAPFLTLLPAA